MFNITALYCNSQGWSLPNHDSANIYVKHVWMFYGPPSDPSLRDGTMALCQGPCTPKGPCAMAVFVAVDDGSIDCGQICGFRWTSKTQKCFSFRRLCLTRGSGPCWGSLPSRPPIIGSHSACLPCPLEQILDTQRRPTTVFWCSVVTVVTGCYGEYQGPPPLPPPAG